MGAFLFVNPATVLAMLLMLLSSGVRDLASCMSTDAYWRAKSVTVSAEQLTHELDPVKPADISKLIGDLDADDPKTRDEASARIAAIGPAALPGLKEAAKSPAPEVASRARSLLSKIRAGSKAAAVRRPMAIRTLGERKDAAALPVLQALVNSPEMFEADYAKAAIAKIQGVAYESPVPTETQRMAEVNLLPSRLDLVVQICPRLNNELALQKLIDMSPMPQERRAQSLEEANTQILKVLETVGNVRLNALTWGFYAAPPGVPGNTIVMAQGTFDSGAVAAALSSLVSGTKKINGMDVFQIDDDSALILGDGGRIVYVSREPGGDLALEAMTQAMQKGAGDFAKNADLAGLVKTVDIKQPMWGVMKVAAGLKEIIGPLGAFDTATITADQTLDHDKVVTNMNLVANATDAAGAKQAVDAMNAELRDAVEQGRREEKSVPMIKPMIDFVESIKVKAEEGKATASGKMQDVSPIGPMMLMGRGQPEVIQQPVR